MSGDGDRGAESGTGVPVVRLGAGEGARRYELDEAALRRVLLRRDVQDLPAVVLSVAGAYRGGKSFILDFFLRYLNAPRSSQLSGEWLGREDERLKGFHWRGGADRDTTGIHLWPEPIITTLDNGEKVAVLLMDTQGTFDSESTIGQNSTIFALSTLISSVQIYNLSGNIREDDLQHLQLFTEYGKLACEAEGKAFQTLLFLVRDWIYPYEHAHGFVGGDALLNKRLQSNPKQKTELREVREHIRSCFDSIKCFLMPHPGLAVEDQGFAGCLRDLTEKFRLALLELVPSLFDPQHLTPKLINGERVRTQDLFEYFRKYIDIFNSDEVPEATTIFKATADACLLAAARSASAVYAARMKERVSGERSLSQRALVDAHTCARAEAERVYAQKKKLGSKHDAKAKLEELIKELDASLSLYVLNNDAMVRETMSLARKSYDAAVSNVCGEQARLCLHPGDLVELHAEALQEALTVFDSAREVCNDAEDEQRTALVQSLEQQYDQLCVVNEQNNKSAVLGARDLYVTRMKLQMDHTGISNDKLEAQNQQAREDATAFLAKQRNRTSELEDDPYVQKLLEEISSSFADFEKANINNNRIAMQVAEFTYNKYVMSEWGSQICCFHPLDLQALHKRAVDAALNQFMVNREQSEVDDSKAEMVKILGIHFSHLEVINQFNNEQSVEQAFLQYSMKMDRHTRPSVLSILVVPFFVKLLALLPGHHESARMLAISDFYSRRRGTASCYSTDAYLDDLKQKMDAAYENYRNPVLSFLRELGINYD